MAQTRGSSSIFRVPAHYDSLDPQVGDGILDYIRSTDIVRMHAVCNVSVHLILAVEALTIFPSMTKILTKISPGRLPQTIVSGMRKSAQPIQRISGHWPFVRSAKAFGFASEVFAEKSLLPATMRSMRSRIR